VAAVAAGGALAEPLEGPEAANLGGRDDLPGFGHRQDSTSVAGPSGDLDVSARDVVLDGDNPGPVPQMGIAVPRLPCSKLPGHELLHGRAFDTQMPLNRRRYTVPYSKKLYHLEPPYGIEP
jgi:hypothetical protein